MRVDEVGHMGFLGYNTGVNHIKSGRMLSASHRLFSTDVKGIDTMSYSIPNSSEQSNIPVGFCHCGCGQKTPLAKYTRSDCGQVKGQPIRFVRGHHARQRRDSLDGITLLPGTRAIPLTQNKFTIVDEADYEYLMQWGWRAQRDGRTWYAMRHVRLPDGKETCAIMHRVLLDAPDGAKVDHKDGDGLNNTRDNLRLATNQENGCNRQTNSNSVSGYKGVTWNKRRNKWQANIKVNGKRIYLALVADAEVAARVYDAAARLHFGKFARLNFPEDVR